MCKMSVKNNCIAFMTLGCKVNQYETGKLIKQFETAGFRIVPFNEAADIYVVNTCTVTNIADRKSRKMLHRARRLNENAVVVALGCFAEAGESALKEDEGIDIIIGNKQKAEAFDIITDYINDRGVLRAEPVNTSEENTSEKEKKSEDMCNEHTRAYIKVQDGCNQFCTYCKIPYVRGKLKSRSIADVYEEACLLSQNGYREIVLTGIHLSSYGVDFTDCVSFIDLQGKPLYELILKLSEIEGIDRIRLGSLEPRIITDGFVRSISGVAKLCPHFHLSLQSGCDSTLERMKRKYSVREYRNSVELLRKYYELPAITTDVIVGFPGETEKEFEESLEYVKEIGFSAIHVFKYSKRDGTVAAGMKNQVNENIKNKRAGIMGGVTDTLMKNYRKNFINHTESCLVEEVTYIRGRRYYSGHNERYIKFVFDCEDKDEILINTIVNVCPKEVWDDGIMFCSYKKPC